MLRRHVVRRTLSEQFSPGQGYEYVTQSDITANPVVEQRRERVQQTLAQIGPTLVRSAPLFDLLRTDPTDADAVGEIIRRCPGLSARIISVINSAAFGISRRISSVQRAVNLLGSTRARTLSLAHGLRVINEATQLPRRLIDQLWNNSLAKASAAKMLCQHCSSAPAEEAYALGLIQDIGLPMLMVADIDFYRQYMLGQDRPGQWAAMEKQHFGIDHMEVGRALLAEWNAPDALQEAVLHHHAQPDKIDKVTGDEMLSLATFFAGLLPHWQEDPDPWQHEWINTIHAHLLAKEYASPHTFMKDVITEARQIAGNDQPLDDITEHELLQRLVGEVAKEGAEAVTQLSSMENTFYREREGLQQLRQEAFTDPLTKVLNRRGFAVLAERRLREAITAGESVCCMLSDLDDFKNVNDTYGHETGDQVLRALSKLMRRSMREGDLLARLGGDEFAVFMVGLDKMGAKAAARHILHSLSHTRVRVAPGLEMKLPVSLGVTFADEADAETTVDDLLALADQAMYHRKRRGKRGMHFVMYSPWSAGEDVEDSDEDEEEDMPRPVARRSKRED